MPHPASFVEWFGPCMWKTLHSISFTYPDQPNEDDQRKYANFFYSVGDVIPCPACAKHFRQQLAHHPLQLESRDALTRWVYDAHDRVNKQNGKISPSFEEITKQYSSWTKQRSLEYQSRGREKFRRTMADPYLDGDVPKESRGLLSDMVGTFANVLQTTSNTTNPEGLSLSDRNFYIMISVIMILILALIIVAYKYSQLIRDPRLNKQQEQQQEQERKASKFKDITNVIE